jgi:general secretion pathway protein E
MVTLEPADILLRKGLLDSEQIEKLRSQSLSGSQLIDAAIGQGLVEEEPALRALGDELGMDFVDLRNIDVDVELVKSFPQKLIYRHAVFPISRVNGSLTLATSEPLDVYALDEASVTTGLNIVPVVAEKSEIARLMKKHLGVGSETVEGLLAAKEDDDDIQLLEDLETDGSELSEMAQEASVVRLVNEILVEAIDSRSSDVHVESQAGGLVIRYRIDGILHDQPVPPEINQFQAAIISRLKIMARLNIAEKRLPQDGRIKLKVHGREIDIDFL